MRPGDEDARIREAIAEAHRDDHAPAFQRVLAGARRGGPSRRSLRSTVLAAGLSLATALTLWLLARPAPVTGSWRPTGTRWVAPTDFLLETPDLVTLRTLPTLDPRGVP